jgi:hypothetical protein
VSKLSELVAVRVMGAKVIDTIDPVPKGFYVRNHAAYYGDDAGLNRCECFMPATSIADAMRVADQFTDYEIAKGGESYTVTISGFLTATEKTKELAICIAALRACGVPEREIEEARKQQ